MPFPLEQVKGELVGSHDGFPWSVLMGEKEGGDDPNQLSLLDFPGALKAP